MISLDFEAVIHETLRFTCIAPFGIPHYTREEVQTSDGRYLISAGSTVFPNFYQIMNNPKVFENPRQFNPSRFLDKNNNFVKHDHNIVFGIGKSKDILQRDNYKMGNGRPVFPMVSMT